MRLLLAALLVFPLAAQDPRYKAQSRLVVVPVSVVDAQGQIVHDLEASDFLVLDQGRPQKITVDTLATGVAPLALVIAVQSSGISAAVLEKVQKIGDMIQPFITGPRGCAALLAFDDRIRWRTDCTNNPDKLEVAFAHLSPGEQKSARMLDALHEAIDRLRQIPNTRRVVLLISESRDRDSQTELEAVVTEAQTEGVTIYAATYSAFKTAFTTKSSATGAPQAPKPPPAPGKELSTLPGIDRVYIPPPEQRVDLLGTIGELKRLHQSNTTRILTDATGGVTFPFTRQKALQEAIEKLGIELNTQYLLSFTPDAPPPGYHSLEVRITRAGDFGVRARPGYWAAVEPK